VSTSIPGLIATTTGVWGAAAEIRDVAEQWFAARFGQIANSAVQRRKHDPSLTWRAFLADDLFVVGADAVAGLPYIDERVPEYGNVVVLHLHAIVGALHRIPTHTFAEVDLGFDIQLLPNGRGRTLPPLVFVGGQRSRELREALVEARAAFEYGYWDGSERPAGLSTAEWAARKRAWSVVGRRTPADAGLGISMPTLMRCAELVRVERP